MSKNRIYSKFIDNGADSQEIWHIQDKEGRPECSLGKVKVYEGCVYVSYLSSYIPGELCSLCRDIIKED